MYRNALDRLRDLLNIMLLIVKSDQKQALFVFIVTTKTKIPIIRLVL